MLIVFEWKFIQNLRIEFVRKRLGRNGVFLNRFLDSLRDQIAPKKLGNAKDLKITLAGFEPKISCSFGGCLSASAGASHAVDN
jgi:hypothetical protein